LENALSTATKTPDNNLGKSINPLITTKLVKLLEIRRNYTNGKTEEGTKHTET